MPPAAGKGVTPFPDPSRMVPPQFGRGPASGELYCIPFKGSGGMISPPLPILTPPLPSKKARLLSEAGLLSHRVRCAGYSVGGTMDRLALSTSSRTLMAIFHSTVSTRPPMAKTMSETMSSGTVGK